MLKFCKFTSLKHVAPHNGTQTHTIRNRCNPHHVTQMDNKRREFQIGPANWLSHVFHILTHLQLRNSSLYRPFERVHCPETMLRKPTQALGA